MKKILHLIQCLSGGGAARELVYLAGYSHQSREYQHRIVTLHPSMDRGLQLADAYQVSVLETPTISCLHEEIDSADILQVHWWNNPEISHFLHTQFPKTRLVIRYHVAGEKTPHKILPQHFQMADANVTSFDKLSLLAEFSDEWQKDRVHWILHGTDFNRLKEVRLKAHRGFNIGYIGTIAYVKMHQDYLRMSSAIDIPDIKFIICGGVEEPELIRFAQSQGQGGKFDFRGYVEDIAAVISEMDVFGYPLCPQTYASTDLVLQEVMYAGIPAVVFPYGGLVQTVKDGFNGIVVQNADEYKKAIEYLYRNPEERARMGVNAKKHICRHFGIQDTMKQYHAIYQKILQQPKIGHEWGKDVHKSLLEQPLTLADITGISLQPSTAELFSESLGEHGGQFKSSMSAELSAAELFKIDIGIAEVSDLVYRGGIIWYRNYAPDDAYLNFWAGLKALKLGEGEQAVFSFVTAKNNGFSHWRLYYYLAIALKMTGKIKDAQAIIHSLSQNRPGYEKEVACLEEENSLLLAKQSSKEKQSPATTIEEMHRKAVALAQAGKDVNAIQILLQLLSYQPAHAAAHNDLGLLYYNSEEKDKALQCYRKATQLQPDNITFQKNLADFYYVEQGRVEDALEHYAKALSNNPADLNTLFMLGHISVSRKRFGEATKFYNKVLKFEPGNKDAREFLEKLEKCRLSVVGGQADQVNNEADSNGYLVSAIVSTYNAERFIRGCLENLENQTISDKLEIIVVNSGSQQNEETVVKEFQKKYSNIKYLKTYQRETVYTAWNRGIKAANGKYITNANTDDRHRQDALEKLVDILEKRPDMVLAYGDCFTTRVENEKFNKFTPAGRYEWPDFSRNSLLNACIIGPQPVWRRSLHSEFGYFDEDYRCGADYEFWLRISERYNFIHIREYLGLYFANKNTISMKGDLPKKEMEEIKETYRKRYDRVPVLTSGEESIYRILHELNMDKTEVNVFVNSGISDTLLKDILKLPSVGVYKKGQRSSVHNWDAILISANEVEEFDFVELMSNLDFRYIGISDTAYRLSEKKCTDLLNGLSELGCHNLFEDCAVFEWSERAIIGRILFEQGKLQEAARYLYRLLNTDPTDVNSLNIMGLIAFQQKSFDIAEEFLLKALQLDRRNVDTLINLTKICLAMDQHQKARELAKQAIEIDGAQQHVLERMIEIHWDEEQASQGIGYSRYLSPKRILVINNLYPPQELGGYGRLLCDFANILEKRGHTIQVLTSDTPYLGQIEKDEFNIDRGLLLYGGWQDGVCKQVDGNDRVIQTIKTNLEKVRSILRRFRPELCLLGNIDFLSHMIFSPFLEMSIPVIHHLGNKTPGYSVNHTPQSNLYRLATASRWLRDEIVRQGYPLKEISVVYPGALVKEFRMDFLPTLDKLRIAYAGIVLPYKGPQILIEALKRLHDRGADFSCALAGTTTDVRFVDKLKKLVTASEMEDKIEFIGFLPRDQLKAFFARHNVLVFPSLVEEAFGISQVEAMAAGLTAISSGTGGAKEIIEHGKSGLIFEPNNSESLAQELLSLVENPERWQSIAEGGRKRAAEKFDIERSVDILEQEFSKLLRFT